MIAHTENISTKKMPHYPLHL